jgi:hypothetical protein
MWPGPVACVATPGPGEGGGRARKQREGPAAPNPPAAARLWAGRGAQLAVLGELRGVADLRSQRAMVIAIWPTGQRANGPMGRGSWANGPMVVVIWPTGQRANGSWGGHDRGEIQPPCDPPPRGGVRAQEQTAGDTKLDIKMAPRGFLRPPAPPPPPPRRPPPPPQPRTLSGAPRSQTKARSMPRLASSSTCCRPPPPPPPRQLMSRRAGGPR